MDRLVLNRKWRERLLSPTRCPRCAHPQLQYSDELILVQNNQGGYGNWLYCKSCREGFVGPTILEEVKDRHQRI